ncbi:MAG TPA: cupin domain-containing protein [Ktedonobacterales bacterium]
MTGPSDSVGDTPFAPASAGILRSSDAAPAADLGPNRAAFTLSGDETGGRYSLTEFTMAPPPAPGPPPHIHEDADEAIYVLEGMLEMTVGDQRLTGSAGAVMLVPKGTLHALANAGSGPTRFLIILSPPGYEGFWREMAELRARLGGPPDADTALALQRKYHLNTSGEARRFE